MTDLKDKIVAITGGAGLLGQQHARALAEQGAHIALLDVDASTAAAQAELLQADYDVEAAGIACDITSEDAVGTAHTQIRGRFGDGL